MSLNFSIYEFCIDKNHPLTIGVADKILKNFILPLQLVRDRLGIPVYVSQSSGYRPVEWEINHGRSGNSQHTFIGDGAADITCEDNNQLLAALIQHSPFSRITQYKGKNFIHVDYKFKESGIKHIYESDNFNNWTLIAQI